MTNDEMKVKEFLDKNNIEFVFDGGKFWFDAKKLSWMIVNHTDIELWSVFTWRRSDSISQSSYDQYIDIMLAEIKGDL